MNYKTHLHQGRIKLNMQLTENLQNIPSIQLVREVIIWVHFCYRSCFFFSREKENSRTLTTQRYIRHWGVTLDQGSGESIL